MNGKYCDSVGCGTIRTKISVNIIQDELNKLDIICNNISVIQDKDGVAVARIVSDEESYIVKYFQKNEYRREIENYWLLEFLGIQIIRVIASTDSVRLLEDISRSPIFRLGTQEDMSDSAVLGWKLLDELGTVFIDKIECLQKFL